MPSSKYTEPALVLRIWNKAVRRTCTPWQAF